MLQFEISPHLNKFCEHHRSDFVTANAEKFLDQLKGRKFKHMSLMIWLAICWSLWRKRNDVLFNDESRNAEGIVLCIKIISWNSLIIGCRSRDIFSFYDWWHFHVDILTS